MIYKTSKPIVFNFFNNLNRYIYKNYELQLKTDRGYTRIYRGRTFFDYFGRTSIEVSNILRDFAFKNKLLFFADKQDFRLDTFLGSFQNMVYPVEKNGEGFYTTFCKIILEGEEPQEKEITILDDLFFEKINKENIQNPYSVQQNPIIQNFSTINNKVISHIPNLPIDNFTLPINFSINKRYNDMGNELYLCTENSSREIIYSGQGNYNLAIPLITFFNINNANRTIYLSNHPHNFEGEKMREEIAKIDECPSDFYVSFCANNVWRTFPFNATAKIINNSEKKEVEDMLGNRNVYSTSNYSTIELYTRFLSDDEYLSYSTIINADQIILLNVKNKKSTFCTIEDSNIDEIASHDNHKPHQIKITLREKRVQKI